MSLPRSADWRWPNIASRMRRFRCWQSHTWERVAQELCAQAELPWLDLSGNARIIAPGIFYQNLGNPNRFRRVGRPVSAFGPKGARITRRLLMEPTKPLRQAQPGLRHRSG